MSSARRMSLPFLAFYMAQVLRTPSGEIGVVLAMGPFFTLFGQGLGGGLSDRWGRRRVIVLSLASEALFVFLMAWANSFVAFAILNALSGLLASAFWPATQAVVADTTPATDRARSYTFLYFAHNIGSAIGPAIGAGLALTHHALAFSLTAGILLSWSLILLALPETRPSGAGTVHPRAHYRAALQDPRLLLYSGGLLLWEFAYSAMDQALPLYLVKLRFVGATSAFALFMSLNGILVVFFSLVIVRFTESRSSPRVLAAASALNVLTFVGLAYCRSRGFLLGLDIPFTLAEMLSATVAGAFVASIAPTAARGTYMGIAGLAGSAASGLGPLVSGVLLGILPYQSVVFMVAATSLASSFLFLLLGRYRSPSRPTSVPA